MFSCPSALILLVKAEIELLQPLDLLLTVVFGSIWTYDSLDDRTTVLVELISPVSIRLGVKLHTILRNLWSRGLHVRHFRIVAIPYLNDLGRCRATLVQLTSESLLLLFPHLYVALLFSGGLIYVGYCPAVTCHTPELNTKCGEAVVRRLRGRWGRRCVVRVRKMNRTSDEAGSVNDGFI